MENKKIDKSGGLRIKSTSVAGVRKHLNETRINVQLSGSRGRVSLVLFKEFFLMFVYDVLMSTGVRRLR